MAATAQLPPGGVQPPRAAAAARARCAQASQRPLLGCAGHVRPAARAAARVWRADTRGAVAAVAHPSLHQGARRRIGVATAASAVAAPPAPEGASRSTSPPAVAPAPAAAPPPAAGFNPVTREFVLTHLSAERGTLLVALLALVACTVCSLSAPLMSSAFFESLIGRRPPGVYPLAVAGLLATYVLEPLLTAVYVRAVFRISEGAFERIRNDAFRALLLQRVAFFDAHKTAELSALLTGELGTLRALLNDNVGRDRGLRAVCEALGTLAILGTLSWQLAPVLVVLVSACAASAALFTRRNALAFGKDIGVQAAMTEAASTSFANIRTVRSFSLEAPTLARFARLAAAARDSGLGIGRLKSRLEGVNRGAIYASLFTLYAYGGWLVTSGHVPVGVILASVGYTFILTFATQCVATATAAATAAAAATERVARPRRGITNTLLDVAKARGALERLRALISTAAAEPSLLAAFPAGAPGGVPPEEAAAARAAAAAGDVELRGVSFAYPGRRDAPVLRGVDLRLPRGRVTALVGRSGAGKSTIAQLLARFYEPSEGQLLLGGEPLARFGAAAWAAAVAYVPQEPVLFSGSVAENIAFGAAGASREAVEAAAAAANATEFIERLPQGFDTQVGDRGAALSGGQRQRIAIARAILKAAPVLILDEATSALDSVSEAAVQAALDRLAAERTVLVIAHRLSTVKAAHQIVVLGEGRVLEVGTHEQLLERGGAYRALVAGRDADTVTLLTL